MPSADFTIKSLKGVLTLAEGRVTGILANGLREGREAMWRDWTFDVLAFETDRTFHGPDPGPVGIAVFTGLGTERFMTVVPGPAIACIYGAYDLHPSLGLGPVRIACLLDAKRQSLDDLLRLLPDAA